MVTLDTNAIIYYLKDDANAIATLEAFVCARTPMFLATVMELELFSLPTITVPESERIEALLLLFSIFPLNSEIARKAAELRRRSKLKIADSIIAATALFTHSTLVTRNVRDFKKVAELDVQTV